MKCFGSVYVIYFIYGVKYNINFENGGDEDMFDVDLVIDVVFVYYFYLVIEEKFRGEFLSFSLVLYLRVCVYCL